MTRPAAGRGEAAMSIGWFTIASCPEVRREKAKLEKALADLLDEAHSTSDGDDSFEVSGVAIAAARIALREVS